MAFSKNLGVVSSKYESGGKGVEFVSAGRSWGDPGGDSYGIHQLSGAYSMGAFLRSEWGEPYAEKFDGMKPNTDRFNRQYKKVAEADPDGFAYAQKTFYATTHYLPVRKHAAKLGFDVTDRGVQEALFSMSVQHGRAKHIVTEAAEDGVAISTVSQIRSLFKHRSDYVNGLRTLSKKIKSNIINNRYANEVQDAVALAGVHEDSSVTEKRIDPSPRLNVDVLNGTDEIANGLITGLKVFVSLFSSLFGALAGMARSVNRRMDESKVKQPHEDLPDFNDDAPSTPTSSREPPWMHTAKGLMGTDEIAGRRNNSVIIKWAKDFGGFVKSYYTKDSIPWCGLFEAHIFQANDIPVTFVNPLGARNWMKFGFPTEPQYGAVMVFSRKGGGHVGNYVSEDSKYYHILGGNQSDTVNVTKVAKSRFLGARWPKGYDTIHQELSGRIVKKFDGKVSTNEK
jgi:uncharacterized protein (TIGR02594 family)